jgi:hypothetical protein
MCNRHCMEATQWTLDCKASLKTCMHQAAYKPVVQGRPNTASQALEVQMGIEPRFAVLASKALQASTHAIGSVHHCRTQTYSPVICVLHRQ